jgi:hypothetical protein
MKRYQSHERYTSPAPWTLATILMSFKWKYNKILYQLTNFAIDRYFGAKQFASENRSIFKHKAARALLLRPAHVSH